jgi:hypothetical protein
MLPDEIADEELLCRILCGEERGVMAGLDWNCQDISELCDSPESEWQ